MTYSSQRPSLSAIKAQLTRDRTPSKLHCCIDQSSGAPNPAVLQASVPGALGCSRAGRCLKCAQGSGERVWYQVSSLLNGSGDLLLQLLDVLSKLLSGGLHTPVADK